MLPSGTSRGGKRSGRGTCAKGCEECGAGKGGSFLRQGRPSHSLRPTKARAGVPTAGARVPPHPNGWYQSMWSVAHPKIDLGYTLDNQHIALLSDSEVQLFSKN